MDQKYSPTKRHKLSNYHTNDVNEANFHTITTDLNMKKEEVAFNSSSVNSAVCKDRETQLDDFIK